MPAQPVQAGRGLDGTVQGRVLFVVDGEHGDDLLRIGRRGRAVLQGSYVSIDRFSSESSLLYRGKNRSSVQILVAITPPDEPCTVSAIFSDPCSPSFEEPWAKAEAGMAAAAAGTSSRGRG